MGRLLQLLVAVKRRGAARGLVSEFWSVCIPPSPHAVWYQLMVSDIRSFGGWGSLFLPYFAGLTVSAQTVTAPVELAGRVRTWPLFDRILRRRAARIADRNNLHLRGHPHVVRDFDL